MILPLSKEQIEGVQQSLARLRHQPGGPTKEQREYIALVIERLQSELTATRKALEKEREIVKWLERKPAEVHCDFKCGYGKHGNKDECHCGFADWEASRPSPQVKP